MELGIGRDYAPMSIGLIQWAARFSLQNTHIYFQLSHQNSCKTAGSPSTGRIQRTYLLSASLLSPARWETPLPFSMGTGPLFQPTGPLKLSYVELCCSSQIMKLYLGGQIQTLTCMTGQIQVSFLGLSSSHFGLHI